MLKLYLSKTESDGAMVARGDLGAEIALEDVPLVQEEIVRINRELPRPTIDATHMLESMITFQLQFVPKSPISLEL